LSLCANKKDKIILIKHLLESRQQLLAKWLGDDHDTQIKILPRHPSAL